MLSVKRICTKLKSQWTTLNMTKISQIKLMSLSVKKIKSESSFGKEEYNRSNEFK
ncbi:MAG: hypothetical protein CM15mP73_2970 [Hyphomicrobiales bacterium]|nr:MAG: hypothetical protein CM15mP73_2970 [Hyphomicrobiales bacterium]